MNLIQKLKSRYNNLSPQQKAFADMAGTCLGICLCSATVIAVVELAGAIWVAGACILYGIGGLIKTIYQSRVEYHQLREKLK